MQELLQPILKFKQNKKMSNQIDIYTRNQKIMELQLQDKQYNKMYSILAIHNLTWLINNCLLLRPNTKKKLIDLRQEKKVWLKRFKLSDLYMECTRFTLLLQMITPTERLTNLILLVSDILNNSIKIIIYIHILK